MSEGIPAIVVALFIDPVSAVNAVKALRDADFDREQIGYVARNPGSTGDGPNTTGTNAAAAVLATGLAAGVAGASGIMPGVGMLGASAIGAAMIASGALENGVRTALTGAGMSEDEASYFENEYESDRSIVIVKTVDRVEEASRILQRHGGVGRVR